MTLSGALLHLLAPLLGPVLSPAVGPVLGSVVAGAAAAGAVVLLRRPGPAHPLNEPAGETLGATRGEARPNGWRARRHARRLHAAAVAELPHLVALVAVGAEAGAPVATALTHACDAHRGPLADRLRTAAEAVAWGADPVQAWEGLADEPALAALGRALARSARTGASVVRTLETVADDLAAQTRATREDAARQVGVRAAVPLGVCLLPAFLLVGIVPLVAGMATSLLP